MLKNQSPGLQPDNAHATGTLTYGETIANRQSNLEGMGIYRYCRQQTVKTTLKIMTLNG